MFQTENLCFLCEIYSSVKADKNFYLANLIWQNLLYIYSSLKKAIFMKHFLTVIERTCIKCEFRICNHQMRILKIYFFKISEYAFETDIFFTLMRLCVGVVSEVCNIMLVHDDHSYQQTRRYKDEKILYRILERYSMNVHRVEKILK